MCERDDRAGGAALSGVVEEMAVLKWNCPKCRETLGTVTRTNDLVLTAPAATIERTRTGAIIHCRCGKSMLWSGRRVILNSSVLKRQAL